MKLQVQTLPMHFRRQIYRLWSWQCLLWIYNWGWYDWRCPSERTHGLQEGGRRGINTILCSWTLFTNLAKSHLLLSQYIIYYTYYHTYVIQTISNKVASYTELSTNNNPTFAIKFNRVFHKEHMMCALTDDYSKFLWDLQFFKEEVLLPYRIELVEIFNYNLANNYIDFKKQSKEDLNEKKNYYILYADSYLHLLLILQSASCFQHFLLSNIILFPNQYIYMFRLSLFFDKICVTCCSSLLILKLSMSIAICSCK